MTERRGFRYRPHKSPTSLLRRVLAGVFSLLVIGGLLVALSTWINGRQAAWQAYDRILLGAANDIAASIRIIDGTPQTDLPVSAFELLAQAPDDRVSYVLRGPDGAILTGFQDPNAIIRTPANGSGRSPARGTEPVFFDGPMQGETARYVEVTRRFAERDYSGAVTVTVGQTQTARRAMAQSLLWDALVPMAIAGLALLLTAYIVIRSAMRPISSVADDLLRRDPYDLTAMNAADLPAEMGVILEAMNRFMGRLDRQVDAMRNLISDTAHQLRTPVAAIRVQAESIVEEPDQVRLNLALDRLLVRTRSLGTLLDQMLSRALVIHRTDSVPRTALDLRDVALEIIDGRDHEVLAPGSEVELVIGPDPVTVMADEFSLNQAARNLLSNALKHGTAPVRIGVDVSGPEACLWVEDSGPGPKSDVLARLGKRFERSTASPEDSVGLGLSIVTSVAEAFGGRVHMARSYQGFRVSLILPVVTNNPAPSTRGAPL